MNATPNPRTPIDRRQRDGLGLLPRATNSRERKERARANRLVALVLTLFGAFVVVGSLTSLVVHPVALGVLALLLGLFILSQGVLLARRPERRQSNRRKARE